MLEAAKVSDFIVFCYSTEEEVDEYGELCLSSLMAQGIPSVINIALGMDSKPSKKKNEIKKALLSYVADFFPEESKILPLDTESDVFGLIRHISVSHPKSVVWRDRHPYMVILYLPALPPSNLLCLGFLPTAAI